MGKWSELSGKLHRLWNANYGAAEMGAWVEYHEGREITRRRAGKVMAWIAKAQKLQPRT